MGTGREVAARRIHGFHHVDAPLGVIALVIVVVHLAVEQLHADRDGVIFGEGFHLPQAVDRVLLEQVLASVGGHQARAAEILGLSRNTLRTRLQQLGLTVGKVLQEE